MRHEFLYATIVALAALTLPACSDDGADTTASQPTTGPALPGSTSTTTDDGGSTSTTTEDNATTDVTDSTSSPTTGGPVDSLEYCIPGEDDGIVCDAIRRTWCDEVGALAEAHIPETYVKIVRGMCDRDDPPCLVCWNLANYCAQVSEDCADLDLVCGCLAVAHGEVSP